MDTALPQKRTGLGEPKVGFSSVAIEPKAIHQRHASLEGNPSLAAGLRPAQW